MLVARQHFRLMNVRLSWGLCGAAGACYHALGFHRSAARDYSAAFAIEQKDSSNETKMQQFLSFYQVCFHVQLAKLFALLSC